MKYCIPRLLLASLLAMSNLAAEQESSVLSLKTHIALPNVNGRIDHLSVDVKGQRLFGHTHRRGVREARPALHCGSPQRGPRCPIASLRGAN
jgi:hypothetical protein